MKSLVTLHLAILDDLGLLCGIDVARDKTSVLSRVEHEGESFLTITLPAFVKSLEKGLHTGRWPQQDATGFSHVRGLPAFMRGFLLRVFSDDGGILDDPDANCVWAVRQFGNLSQKVERDCTPRRVDAAFKSFIDTDEELGAFFRICDPGEEKWAHFSRVTLSLFGDLFDKLETKVAAYDLIPRHGPGAVADRLDHPQRWEFEYWPERLAEVFPPWRYSENVSTTFVRSLIPVEAEMPVRVITVPKTQKTPRIIAIEPSTMQYAQQGLKREIYDIVKNSSLFGVLGFTDQERNQRMALQGSIDGSLATLDLSEASDRVHLRVVERLLSRWPHLRDFVLSTRSRRADVRGDIVILNKFASMGSALTFPIEAIIFTVLAAMGQGGRTDSPSGRSLSGRVSVYGDDIIVPVDTVSAVIDNLETFGFKVNRHKSFWTGMFRESCGKEYFNGTDVSIVRLRSEVPTSRRDAALINRFTDFRNRAYRSGLWRTVKAADDMLSSVIVIPPRHVEEQLAAPISGMALDTVLATKWRARWNANYQIWQERFPYAKPISSAYSVDGSGGLLKWFFENHDSTDQYQTDKYESQERAQTFHIKFGWSERLPKRSVVPEGTSGLTLN